MQSKESAQLSDGTPIQVGDYLYSEFHNVKDFVEYLWEDEQGEIWVEFERHGQTNIKSCRKVY